MHMSCFISRKESSCQHHLVCKHACKTSIIFRLLLHSRVSLPRDTNVAKSLDFSKLIRLAPQRNNLLNSDTDPSSSSSNQQHQDFETSDPDPLRSVSQYHSLTQANPLSSVVGEGRAFSDSMYKGTWETFLVFGMMCVAIIASMASVVWFIRSYRSGEISPDTQRIRRSHRGDIESLDGSSGYSYDDSTYSSSNQNSLDTRSDFEVELDFEFSEDVNRSDNSTCNTNASSTGTTGGTMSTTKTTSQQPSRIHSYA